MSDSAELEQNIRVAVHELLDKGYSFADIDQLLADVLGDYEPEGAK